MWEPGRDVLAGDDPFRREAGSGSVYPPIAFLVTLPFALPPLNLGLALWLMLIVGAVVGAMWLCGVRSFWAYGLVLISPPVAYALVYAHVTPLVVLAIAACWRWRDSPRTVGVVLGLTVAARLFVWPLLFWLAFTRRWRGLAYALGSTVAFTMLGWVSVGFRGFAGFPDLTRANVEQYAQHGASLVALAVNLGASVQAASALGLVAAALALILAWRSGDLGALTWCIIAALLASPIIWVHYYALLLVPLALGRDRLVPPGATRRRSSY